MFAPPPQNLLEMQLREEINAVLSGSCCSSDSTGTPLFVLSESETNFVNCQSGRPYEDGELYSSDTDESKPSTYGEITMLGELYVTHNNAQMKVYQPEF
jgi:hypothetical protein